MAGFCHMRSGTGRIGSKRIPRTEKEEHRVSAEENKAITSHMNEELWSGMALTHATTVGHGEARRPSRSQSGLDPRGFKTLVQDHRSDES